MTHDSDGNLPRGFRIIGLPEVSDDRGYQSLAEGAHRISNWDPIAHSW
ncbi:MAG: hypothetical protein KBT49_04675 [Bacteroidetes bacterium]|nr:hypothetical protein [Candidatus Colenecus caballi]